MKQHLLDKVIFACFKLAQAHYTNYKVNLFEQDATVELTLTSSEGMCTYSHKLLKKSTPVKKLSNSDLVKSFHRFNKKQTLGVTFPYSNRYGTITQRTLIQQGESSLTFILVYTPPDTVDILKLLSS